MNLRSDIDENYEVFIKNEQQSLLKTIYNKQKDVIFLLADMWRDTILLMKETIYLM